MLVFILTLAMEVVRFLLALYDETPEATSTRPENDARNIFKTISDQCALPWLLARHCSFLSGSLGTVLYRTFCFALFLYTWKHTHWHGVIYSRGIIMAGYMYEYNQWLAFGLGCTIHE
jgi:hypothetical protein